MSISQSWTTPTEFERRLVDMLLAGSMAPMPALRRQWQVTGVRHRTFPRCEVLIEFTVPAWTPRIVPRKLELADVIFRYCDDDQWHGAELDIRDGALTELTIGDPGARARPMSEIVEMSYNMLLDDPDNPGDFVDLPVPDRDWARLLKDLDHGRR